MCLWAGYRRACLAEGALQGAEVLGIGDPIIVEVGPQVGNAGERDLQDAEVRSTHHVVVIRVACALHAHLDLLTASPSCQGDGARVSQRPWAFLPPVVC